MSSNIILIALGVYLRFCNILPSKGALYKKLAGANIPVILRTVGIATGIAFVLPNGLESLGIVASDGNILKIMWAISMILLMYLCVLYSKFSKNTKEGG